MEALDQRVDLPGSIQGILQRSIRSDIRHGNDLGIAVFFMVWIERDGCLNVLQGVIAVLVLLISRIEFGRFLHGGRADCTGGRLRGESRCEFANELCGGIGRQREDVRLAQAGYFAAIEIVAIEVEMDERAFVARLKFELEEAR